MTVDARLLGLIGLIYDAVVEPAGWETALDAIRSHFQFHNAMLAVHGLPRGDAVLQIVVNVTLEQQQIAVKYADHTLALWGGVERISTLPLEEPIIQGQITDAAKWMDNPYFREFAVPQGLVDSVAIGLVRDRHTLASLGFGRHRDRRAISDVDLDGLRTLAPHLTRAVHISRLLDASIDAAASFGAALDASSSGVVLVSQDRSILHANGVAEAMLAAGDPIRVRRGMLDLASEMVPGQFAETIAASAREEVLGRRGIGIPALGKDGRHHVLRIMPLARRSRRDGRWAGAAAAIFIADPSADLDVRADTLDLLFGLTPAEARVFGLAAEGHTVKQIAAIVGSAPNTVKTHLQRVLGKTGRHNRAELANLANDLSLGNRL